MIRTALAILAFGTFAVFAGCNKDKGKGKPTTPGPSGTRIVVTERGFEPDNISVKPGVETTLVFTRKTDKTCAKDVVIKVDATNEIRKQLPLDQPVPITVTFPTSGQIRYACGMDMISGVISVQ